MTKEEKKNTPLTNEEREELIRLRKEKEYLEMENEVLKKLDALVKESSLLRKHLIHNPLCFL